MTPSKVNCCFALLLLNTLFNIQQCQDNYKCVGIKLERSVGIRRPGIDCDEPSRGVLGNNGQRSRSGLGGNYGSKSGIGGNFGSRSGLGANYGSKSGIGGRSKSGLGGLYGSNSGFGSNFGSGLGRNAGSKSGIGGLYGSRSGLGSDYGAKSGIGNGLNPCSEDGNFGLGRRGIGSSLG